MNVASWLPALAGVVVGGVLGFTGGLVKDKLQADRERAKERREEERYLNRLRRERLAGLYAQIAFASWRIMRMDQRGEDRAAANSLAATDALMKANAQIDVEQVPNEVEASSSELTRVVREAANQEASETEFPAAFEDALERFMLAARGHLAGLDQPIT